MVKDVVVEMELVCVPKCTGSRAECPHGLSEAGDGDSHRRHVIRMFLSVLSKCVTPQ